MKVNIEKYCFDLWREKDKELPRSQNKYQYDWHNPQNSKRMECEKVAGRIICNMVATPRPEFHTLCPYFSRLYNELYMPNIQYFENEEWYYSCLFHELTHATGPIFNRPHGSYLMGFWPDNDLCTEEIIAETSAYCLSRVFNFKTDTLQWSAGYLQTYYAPIKGRIIEQSLYTKVVLRVEEAVNYLVEKI